jgi:hypothetical protein
MGLKNEAAVYEFKSLVTAQEEAMEELASAVADEAWDDAYDIVEQMEKRTAQLKDMLEKGEDKEVE